MPVKYKTAGSKDLLYVLKGKIFMIHIYCILRIACGCWVFKKTSKNRVWPKCVKILSFEMYATLKP